MSPVPILCFHAVSEDTRGSLAPWVTTPRRFDQHLDALAGAGYRPVPLARLVAAVHDRGEAAAEDAVVLTFDDGFADFAEAVWPRLVDRGWPATLYVSTGRVGGRFHDRPMLDRRQVGELADAGVEIGAHGHGHLPLDTLAPAAARTDIERSRDLLQDWTGRAVPSFAYPHGFHDRRTRGLVVEAGFTSACAVKQALSASEDDRFALARIMPTGERTAEELLARLRSPRTPVARGGRERLRTTAHRYLRRARVARTTRTERVTA